ncbi:hypothetical protein KFE25_008973 [Diacronema lutheri]|uniref:RRP15-like protein n=1 Tax=Diacronema lutheri TaxID=2081491 RepID=A0A8J5XXV5_DIALT|nr:hypothetical protein KFE25_008973 [Diacronema lutheri]
MPAARENGDEGARVRPSLADVLAGVLAEPLDGLAAVPILAKRKRVELRLAQQRRRAAEESALARVKRERKRRGHVPLGARAARAADVDDAYDASLDALMRQIATRGVVRLFNAVQQAQGGAPAPGMPSPRAAVGGRGEGGAEGLSKDAFMDLLKRAPVRAAPTPVRALAGGQPRAPPPPGAAYLRDDFEFGGVAGKRRMRDWGRADGAADEADSDEGDGLGGTDAADALDALGGDEGGGDDDDDDDDDDLI